MASFAQSQELADLPLIDADGYQAGILRLPGNFLARDECVVGAFVICGPFSVQGLPDDFRFYLAGAGESAGAPGYGGQSVNAGTGGNNDISNQDHGDDRDSATTVGLSSTTEGQLQIGDKDYFRIDITESVTIRMETVGKTDTYGELYDTVGNLFGRDDDDGAYKNFQLTASLDPGTYFLLVRGYNDQSAGEYRLSVSENLAGGNNFESATTIGIPSFTSGLEIDSGERDYFRIDIAGAGNLRIRTWGGTDTYGTLYDSAGNVIAEDDDGLPGEPQRGENFSIQVNIAAGTYYIEVRGFNNTTAGRYGLGVLGSLNISDPVTVLIPTDGTSLGRVVLNWSCSKDFIGGNIEVPFLAPALGYRDNFSDLPFAHEAEAIAAISGCRGDRNIESEAEYIFELKKNGFPPWGSSLQTKGGWVAVKTNQSRFFYGWAGNRMINIGDSGAILFDNQNESGEIIQDVIPFRISAIENGEILSEGEITVRWLPKVK